MPLFVIVSPEDINARLAIFGGKILVHFPNYFECFDRLPENKDSGKQVFAVFPKPEDVHRQSDGGRMITYIWKGDKNSRSSLGELVTMPILPVDALGGVPQAADVAKAAFADLPEPIRIAGVVAAASPEMISALPHLSKDLPAWSAQTIEKYVQSAAK
jgi:hypothetical protein